MRFLVDECAGPAVAKWLRTRGHDVFSVFDEWKGATDDEILDKAYSENWILITNDKDFGEMIFREHRSHRGIVFMRLSDERSAMKIAVLETILRDHSEKLEQTFVTATETRIRFT